MKLTMEIKDEMFSFEYTIGKDERHGGTHPLSSEALRHFTSCMEDCHKLWHFDCRKKDDEINAMAYIEQHPEVVELWNKKYVVHHSV